MLVAFLAASFVTLAFVVRAVGFLILLRRVSPSREQAEGRADEAIALVRTIRDVGPFEVDTLRSTFELHHTRTDVIFCAAHAGDPAVSLVRRLIDAHPDVSARLLIGDDIVSTNAKLNNMVKGWNAADAPWIIFADSNLLLPPEYIASVRSAWVRGTGAVCSPPIGSQPFGLWAEVECAFLNGHQAPWQYASDAFGFGFAQGKTMLVHRSIIEQGGGIAALGRQPAEDAALTKLVRAQGLSVRLAPPHFTQPLGYRTLQEMINRQTRWAQLRRATFPTLYAVEIFSGMAAPLTAAMLAAVQLDISAVGVGAVFMVCWFVPEAIFCWLAAWQLSWRSPLAWMLREALLPVIWLRAWLQRSFVWGGRQVVLHGSPVNAEA